MFKQYLNEKMMLEQDLALLIYSMSIDPTRLNENELNEAFDPTILNKYLNKLGLNIQKRTTKNLFDYAKDMVTGVGKIFLLAMEDGGTEEIKKMLKSITKEDVMDFLLKLDSATLGILSKPIDLISKLTGWQIKANLKKIGKNIVDIVQDIYTSLKDIKDKVVQVFRGETKQVLIQNINKIENTLPNPKESSKTKR